MWTARPQPQTRQCQAGLETPAHPRVSKNHQLGGNTCGPPAPPAARASTAAKLPLPPTGSIRPWLLPPAGRPASDPPCCQAALRAKSGPSRSQHQPPCSLDLKPGRCCGPLRRPPSRRLTLFTKAGAKPCACSSGQDRPPDRGEGTHSFLGPPLTHDDPTPSNT